MTSEKKYARGEFHSVGTILNGVMRKWRHGKDMAMMRVWEVWESCVGPQVAANAQPAAFKGKCLIVHVTGAAWVHQLQFLKTDILNNLNKACGEVIVEELKFKIGTLGRR